MAKRRRKKPNIPQAALDHARQEADVDETPAKAEAKEEVKAEKAESKQAEAAAKPKPQRRRRDIESAKLQKRKNQGALDAEYVAEMLANPTKVVTEDELKSDYTYVIQDLRNMGILAAVLFVALIGISLVVL